MFCPIFTKSLSILGQKSSWDSTIERQIKQKFNKFYVFVTMLSNKIISYLEIDFNSNIFSGKKLFVA
jgi:nicotinamide riboside kinase